MIYKYDYDKTIPFLESFLFQSWCFTIEHKNGLKVDGKSEALLIEFFNLTEYFLYINI